MCGMRGAITTATAATSTAIAAAAAAAIAATINISTRAFKVVVDDVQLASAASGEEQAALASWTLSTTTLKARVLMLMVAAAAVDPRKRAELWRGATVLALHFSHVSSHSPSCMGAVSSPDSIGAATRACRLEARAQVGKERARDTWHPRSEPDERCDRHEVV